MSDEVEKLIKKLQKGDNMERKLAAGKLGKLKDKRAVGPLINALGDEDGTVRWWAAGALGRIGNVKAVEPLIGALGDEDKRVRMYAADALGRIKNEKAVGPLIGVLWDRNSGVRVNAVWALVEIGEPAVKHLVEAAKEPEKRHLRGMISEILKKMDEEMRKKPRDLGCRETEVLKPKKVPEEFERLMLKDVPKARVKA